MQAYLCGAHLPRLPHAARDLFGGKEVTLLRPHGSSECAELTVLDADVREVDVPIDDVADRITNLATALLEAHSASLPVIALANGVPAATDGRGAFQELDAVALMKPVTKWAVRVTEPSAVPWAMARAFDVAVNAAGVIFDGDESGKERDLDIEVATGRDDMGWTAELAIPWALLGTGGIQALQVGSVHDTAST